ncbi:MAG: LicD family protein [Rickettsiales bacterium]|nr:LicD family protein [Rickettsiales bacterium]
MQLAKLKCLAAFDRLCKDNGLVYWLDFGTLLGAVRHGGFIPWDDDLDVGMPRADYEKLESIARALPEKGFVWRYFNRGFLQAYWEGDGFGFQCLDVFPFDAYSKKMSFQEIRDFKARIRPVSDRMTNKWKKIQKNPKVKESKIFGTDRERDFIRDKVLDGKVPAADGTLFSLNLSFVFYNRDWVFPLSEIEFEGMRFPSPANPGAILESQYGNFYQYPDDIAGLHKLLSESIKEQVRMEKEYDGFLALDDDALYEIMTGK